MGWGGMEEREKGGRKERSDKEEREEGWGRVESGRNRVDRFEIVTVKKLLRFY